ncbi:hypothetical protein ACFPES_18795 [Paenibacillus sp. GCM10023248]|uniref:hypothetical protein n=1 Tax=Bacillales TaxID=1385 RepID=UPI002377F6C4|nr:MULTISPECIES: hypothetical protein [Bacillales]MDD9269097.1 hypothetical protein [Paenibacillus sp. MAHUQ-63]MDR6880682.1 hypothetical protein [Bacillus sp. 3255]
MLVSGIGDKPVPLTAANIGWLGWAPRLQRGNFTTGNWRSFQLELLSLDSS